MAVTTCDAPMGRGLVAVPGVRTLNVALAGALAVLAAGHALLLGGLDGLPFQDAPNHLARAVISADLFFHGGSRFGDGFALALEPIPYVLGDVALMFLVEAFGPYAAGQIWTLVVAGSLPAAVAVYLRTSGHATHAVLVGTLVALFLGTDWFFLMGFQSFRLAVALTLLALAAWQRFLATGSRRAFVAYAACLLAGYLTHLAALVFGGVAAVVVAARALQTRRTTLARAAAGGLPLLALAAWHVASSGVAPGGEGGAMIWEPALGKLKRLFSPFRRFELATDAALCAVLGAAGVLALLGHRRGGWRREAVLLPALLAAVFLAMYAAMPMARGYTWFLDVRALPLAALFLLFALLPGVDGRGRRGVALAALAVALAAGNLWVLGRHLPRQNAVMREYREVASRVPPGATVMPVSTLELEGAADPYLHAALFATIESGALSPYLFADGVTRYFKRKHRLPAPGERWYLGESPPPDGPSIASTYCFLLVQAPYDPARIPVRTEVVVRNAAAALLRVVP